jgi:threonine synthase
VRASGGRALAAAEERLLDWQRVAMRAEGIAFCPEAAACLDVLASALRDGIIRADERVVVFNTAAAQKYVEAMRADLPAVAELGL